MLPLPELDDQNFKEIIEEARKMIPRLYPGWTDENFHDPGITFIEMLAWLTEMQQYYLNRITDRNKLKFLNLMGIQLRPALSARTDVTFGSVEALNWMPAGTKLAAGDQIFETSESLQLLPHRIEKILVYTEKDYRDFTSFNETRGLSYYAFGKDGRKNNHLLIGLDQPLPVGTVLSMYVHFYDEYPVKSGPRVEVDTAFIPPARISWKYYGHGADSADWQPLPVQFDETCHLTCGGQIKFIVPAAMEAAVFSPALDRPRFWLACFLEDDIFELPPRIEDICFNTVPAVQQSTASEIQLFSSLAEKNMQFRVDGSLALQGMNELQIREAGGNWVFWKKVDDWLAVGPADQAYRLEISPAHEAVIQFGDGDHGMIPPQGEENIRFISFHPDFYEKRWLGPSSGLPGQSFELPAASVLADDFRLQVGVKARDSADMLWQDWQAVSDFASSGPQDRHYILDEEQGIIYFGNHENGIIPPRHDQPNILLLGFRTGGGIRGNVKDYEINRLADKDPEGKTLQVENRKPAYGGCGKETMQDAQRRLKLERSQPYRAVTAADYEALALATPGLRIARVKAVPLYAPGMQNYPGKLAEAQVTVAVMPYSEKLTPIPSPGFRETVLRHLNRHSLLTTEVHVVAPDYVRISVYASVIVAPGTVRGQEKILEELDRFLQPLVHDDLNKGWPFGRTVYRGDIYEVINQVSGVEYVRDLSIVAEGSGIRRELGGDVKIPPCGLVYPGEHEIEIINRNDL